MARRLAGPACLSRSKYLAAARGEVSSTKQIYHAGRARHWADNSDDCDAYDSSGRRGACAAGGFLAKLSVMSRMAVLLLLAWYPGAVSAAEAKPVDPGRPVVVVDKGGSRAQQERPIFVLYESGLVLFQKAQGFAAWWDGQYFQVTLTPDERAGILALLAPESAFGALPAELVVPPVSTMAFGQLIWVRWGQRSKRVQLSGLVLDEALPAVSPVFRDAFMRLAAYEHPRAAPWQPAELVVETHAFGASKGGSPRPWPRGWPDLKDARTVLSPQGRHSIYLPGSRMAAAKRLVEAQREHGVSINGQRLGIWVREVLPGEAAWGGSQLRFE
jgi:hypothetical protein